MPFVGSYGPNDKEFRVVSLQVTTDGRLVLMCIDTDGKWHECEFTGKVRKTIRKEAR